MTKRHTTKNAPQRRMNKRRVTHVSSNKSRRRRKSNQTRRPKTSPATAAISTSRHPAPPPSSASLIAAITPAFTCSAPHNALPSQPLMRAQNQPILLLLLITSNSSRPARSSSSSFHLFRSPTPPPIQTSQLHRPSSNHRSFKQKY